MAKFLYIILVLFILLQCTVHYSLTPEAQIIYDQLDSLDYPQKIELMQNTTYQTPVFLFESEQNGPVVIILGGTHGNEPAGYEAALRLVDWFKQLPPQCGKIILIPAANRMAVNTFQRRIPVPEGVDIEKGNLNRCHPGNPNGFPMEQLAYEIEQLAEENGVSVFIDLHEAKYLHLNMPEESDWDKALGQTIIYYPNIASAELVIPMLDEINDDISNPDYLFSALEMPIPNSAAWWAGKYLDVAAFTLETTQILDLDQRINWQLKFVNIILRNLDIWSSEYVP